MMPKLFKIYTLAILFNTALILFQPWFRGWDAWTHIFLADHFRNDWFGLWDSRWYNGFDVASYPPLAHQLIAIFGWFNIELGYAILNLVFMTAFPIVVYYFVETIYQEKVAIASALLATFLPSLYFHVYGAGQFTTLVAAVFALASGTAFRRYLEQPSWKWWALSVLFGALTVQAHLISILFLIPLLAISIAEKRRLSGFTVFLAIGALLLLTIFPTIQFILRAPAQVEIPDINRYDLLYQLSLLGSDLNVLLVTLPLIGLVMRRKDLLWVGLFVFYIVLGFGLNTPLPYLVLGGFAKWMVYDRFFLWASIILLFITAKAIALAPRRLLAILLVALLVISTANTFVYYSQRVQPGPIPIVPLANFLNSQEHWRWRYLTLGFGSQMAEIPILAPKAVTPDGNYPTARSASGSAQYLTNSGIGSIDSAKYYTNGAAVLEQVLSNESLGVKFVFVGQDGRVFDPLLEKYGFRPVEEPSSNQSATIWVREGTPIPPPLNLPSQTDFLWGTGSIATLVIALILLSSIVISKGVSVNGKRDSD
jgi:hypothetical protein